MIKSDCLNEELNKQKSICSFLRFIFLFFFLLDLCEMSVLVLLEVQEVVKLNHRELQYQPDKYSSCTCIWTDISRIVCREYGHPPSAFRRPGSWNQDSPNPTSPNISGMSASRQLETLKLFLKDIYWAMKKHGYIGWRPKNSYLGKRG